MRCVEKHFDTPVVILLATDPKEMLDMDSLKAYRQEVEKRDANGNHSEFYFVIADLLDQLLPYSIS